MMPKNRHPVYRMLLATVAIVVTCSRPATMQGPRPSDRRDDARIDQIFSSWAAPERPGCAVSVTRDGTVVFARGYGSANLEYDIPITPATVFHVASISKQFTALAVQLLVNERRVSWNDTIGLYVPEMADLGNTLTLRQLAHHTSGLRDQWSLLRLAGWRFQSDMVTQSDVLQLLGRQRTVNFAPGTRYLYSNSGYTLLALVVERTTGQSLRQFADERIFQPLGMTRTHFHDDHRMIVRNRAYAYATTGPDDYRLSVPTFSVAGSTNLFTTVEDLAHWQRNFRTLDVGGESGLTQLHSVGRLTDGRLTTYAFGLAHGTHRGFHTVSHGGTDAGYRSEVVRFPDHGLGVAVLCNAREARPDTLALQTADVYLPGPGPGRWTATPVSGPRSHDIASGDTGRSAPAGPAMDLSSLAGYYRWNGSDVPLNFVAREGVLTTVGGSSPLIITPQSGNEFRASGSAQSVEFLVSEGSTRLHLRSAGGAPDIYERAGAWRPTINELSALVGHYESVELGVVYTFHIVDDHLALWHGKFGDVRLSPTYEGGFYGDGLYLRFDRAPDGKVVGFSASTPRAWKVRFHRRPESEPETQH